MGMDNDIYLEYVNKIWWIVLITVLWHNPFSENEDENKGRLRKANFETTIEHAGE